MNKFMLYLSWLYPLIERCFVMNKENSNIKKLVLSALFAALICIATMIIKIPTPLQGYLNLGDGFVLLAAWLLPPGFSFLAASIGSALADLFSGYIIYAPITFLIKGLMAICAYFIFKTLKPKPIISRIISGIAAEIVMILGYFVFEGFMYGFIPSLTNIPANAMQGIAGITLAIILVDKIKVLTEKYN